MSHTSYSKRAVAPEVWQEIHEVLDREGWIAAEGRLRQLADETEDLAVRLTLGALLAEHECYGEAIREWVSVMDQAGPQGRYEELAAAYSNLAAVYRELGDSVLARHFQQQALRLLPDCGAVDLLHLANDALAVRCGDVAEVLLRTAAGLCEADDPLLPTILASVGVLHVLRGEPEAAAVFLRQAYRGHRAAGDWSSAGHDLWNLSLVLQQLGRLSQAIRWQRQAVACYGRVPLSAHQRRAERRLRRLQQLQEVFLADPLRN